ncbi:hypothetical protein A4R43_15040 [Amycolatopsis albispora]|uniref:Novel STAND NTPase 1 domain-containing protein n=1 Tax=Amycolatopsis albispora TaxID=1804986 RepID=A0A344L6L0_9PSEU|nr:hypothetical protein A4R43_15040 [Amycolatopsis albispora]
MARRAHYSSTTLSDAAGGRRLPSLEVTLAYVRACGGDVEEWEQRWRSVAVELSTAATPADSPISEGAPYVGLRAYGSEDAEWFFGRERLVDDLLHRITQQRLVAVVGPSGSGTSSLLHAGLVPRLTGLVLMSTPGAHPFEECAIRLAALTKNAVASVREDLMSDSGGLHRQVSQLVGSCPAVGDVVIIVDQFDELFTTCQDDHERTRFVAALLNAATADDSRCRVVLGVCADVLPQCVRLPELADALRGAKVAVGPMSPDELRRAISQPAGRARCAVESGLLATLVALAHNQSGALPWLSQALLETWRRRKGNTLTLAAFEASGGFDAALANTAEAVFTALDQQRQNAARYVFQRLTAPGEEAQDVACAVKVRELHDDPAVADVVGLFIRARLLVRGTNYLELAHEALVHVWPRLRAWLGQDREGRRLHRELSDATALWERHDRDRSALLRGTRLALLRAWADRTWYPNTAERAFLDASVAAEKRDHDTRRRMTLRQRRLVVSVVLVFLMAISIMAYPCTTAAHSPRSTTLADAGSHWLQVATPGSTPRRALDK